MSDCSRNDVSKQILASNYSNAESSAIHSRVEKEHNVSEKKVKVAMIPQDLREDIISEVYL